MASEEAKQVVNDSALEARHRDRRITISAHCSDHNSANHNDSEIISHLRTLNLTADFIKSN